MLIGTLRLSGKPFTHHLIARAHKKRFTKRLVVAGLMLTSMVDMFSLLVIFLLQTFSTSPELLFVSKGVILPSAATSQEIKDAPVLSLTEDGVYLDQKYVGRTDSLLADPNELLKRLAGFRMLWQKVHPKEAFHGEISLQAHKDLSSVVVSQFMAMLPSQQYGSIQLAVIGGGP